MLKASITSLHFTSQHRLSHVRFKFSTHPLTADRKSTTIQTSSSTQYNIQKTQYVYTGGEATHDQKSSSSDNTSETSKPADRKEALFPCAKMPMLPHTIERETENKHRYSTAEEHINLVVAAAFVLSDAQPSHFFLLASLMPAHSFLSIPTCEVCGIIPTHQFFRRSYQ